LAPELIRTQKRLEEAILLLLGAMRDEGGSKDERQRTRVRWRPGIGRHPVVVELIGERQLETADRTRPPRCCQLMVDELGVPCPCHLDAVGLLPRAGRLRLTLTEFGEQRLEPWSPISGLHFTPQSSLS
jgi:hypothetical protein